VKNLLNMLKALVIAVVAFAITFAVIFPLMAGEPHRSYARLLKAWNTPSISLLNLRDMSADVSQQTRDENLEFVAKQLASIASVLSDLGYKWLGEVNAAGKVELFGRAFVEGFVNPAINLKTIPLWWNAKEFEKKAKLLDARNKRMETIRWIVSACIALLSFWWILQTRRVGPYVPARQAEAIDV
jgi:hypothetical protein